MLIKLVLRMTVLMLSPRCCLCTIYTVCLPFCQCEHTPLAEAQQVLWHISNNTQRNTTYPTYTLCSWSTKGRLPLALNETNHSLQTDESYGYPWLSDSLDQCKQEHGYSPAKYREPHIAAAVPRTKDMKCSLACVTTDKLIIAELVIVNTIVWV